MSHLNQNGNEFFFSNFGQRNQAHYSSNPKKMYFLRYTGENTMDWPPKIYPKLKMKNFSNYHLYFVIFFCLFEEGSFEFCSYNMFPKTTLWKKIKIKKWWQWLDKINCVLFCLYSIIESLQFVPKHSAPKWKNDAFIFTCR